jgi:hypothetical protein
MPGSRNQRYLLGYVVHAGNAHKKMHTSYIVDNHRNYLKVEVINIMKWLDGFIFKLTAKSAAGRLPGDMALVNVIAKKKCAYVSRDFIYHKTNNINQKITHMLRLLKTYSLQESCVEAPLPLNTPFQCPHSNIE